jgi:gliding motility-associated-like protein
VYNRFGQRIFYTEDWTNKWNGMFNAKKMDIGTYVWVLQYYDENNVFKQRRGTTILLR